ncbi:MAG: thymidine phosphorylase [Anaerolineales bacterium]|nr:thymidine phosphorylase [Anaerolineales bacterium]
MQALEVIVKKRDGGVLSREEIRFFVEGFARGEIPDYQASAWAMAIVWRGMNAEETWHLTEALADSGEVLDLRRVVPMAVDKHSTGGVGDKTTLVVEPLVAACGVPVGKMSGRGLGFSGGTLDKMESIPGFRVDLSRQEFLDQLRRIGIVLTGQTGDLAPADGALYALRDVTGSVPSIPLIASSVMSKKIAAGAQAIVLDVKVGSGAFMQSEAEARQLARAMVEIGRRAGRRVVALLSDMNQPLGCAVGNALEVREAIDTLRGLGPADFTAHCLEVGATMLVLVGKAPDLRAGKRALQNAIADRSGLGTFRRLVQAQGGDVDYVDHPDRLPTARWIETVGAPQAGNVRRLHAGVVGLTAVDLGAGRQVKGEAIDHSVGIVVHRKVGDPVTAGEPLFTVHANDPARRDAALRRVLEAYSFSRRAVQPLPHLYGKVGP